MSRTDAEQRAHALTDFADGIPCFATGEGRYAARFARTAEEVEAVLRLRYRVFNVELGEGLAESVLTGRDRDRFDDHCHHLLVEDVRSGSVVGTYRLQTDAMAERGHGLYTDQEYDLGAWRGSVLEHAVEIGRACIDREHRHGLVLLMLWRGLYAYAKHHGKRYFFGCCSITSQDAAEGIRVHEYLRRKGHVHGDLYVPARTGWECRAAGAPEEGWEGVKLPKLFRTYLRYGARVCSEPALDREFGTIDYLALLDMRTLDVGRVLRLFAESIRRGT